MMNKSDHWQHVYETKSLEEVSWYEPVPETSLEFVEKYQLAKDAKIIDVGGGDSFLADHLLAKGYTNISVLDISENALNRAKKRLGEHAEKINWIVANAANFKPEETYDFWHDRAAFHFLTEKKDIENYIATVSKHISKNGFLVIGTFSEKGPEKCSGLPVKQYSEQALGELFCTEFEKDTCFTQDHHTPFGTTQNFTFCSFRRK